MCNFASEAYIGRRYMGNGFFASLDDAIKWANDGFNTRLIVVDETTGNRRTFRFNPVDMQPGQVKETTR